jgi:hypothetical protein
MNSRLKAVETEVGHAYDQTSASTEIANSTNPGCTIPIKLRYGVPALRADKPFAHNSRLVDFYRLNDFGSTAQSVPSHREGNEKSTVDFRVPTPHFRIGHRVCSVANPWILGCRAKYVVERYSRCRGRSL